MHYEVADCHSRSLEIVAPACENKQELIGAPIGGALIQAATTYGAMRLRKDPLHSRREERWTGCNLNARLAP